MMADEMGKSFDEFPFVGILSARRERIWMATASSGDDCATVRVETHVTASQLRENEGKICYK